jgi:hypothetical protein
MDLQDNFERTYGTFQRSPRKFRRRHFSLNCTRFAQETGLGCLEPSVGPEDNTDRSGFERTVFFRNASPL